MMQSLSRSALEAVANVVVGFGLAFATQLVVFPVLGLQVGLHDNLRISAAFLAVSLLRSYALRRLFGRRGTG